jgi:hypothetical protein
VVRIICDDEQASSAPSPPRNRLHMQERHYSRLNEAIFTTAQMRSTGSDVTALARRGIPVRHDADQRFHMHHKFAVRHSFYYST